MFEREPRKSRKQRFLEEHPVCCFCGGGAKSVGLDHVPPQACFPKDLVPDAIEFPACKACNHVSRPYDLIFGYYAMLSDYDLSNLNIDRAEGLHQGLRNNFPGAAPEFAPSANKIRAYLKQIGRPRTPGLLLKQEGMVLASTDLGDAATMIGRKLGCALYYREKGKVLPKTHRIHTAWHQAQDPQMQDLNAYLAEALTNRTVATKANVKRYGDRLTIQTADSDDGLFGYSVQFGQGLIVWGMIAEAGVLEGTRSLRTTWPVLGDHGPA